MRYFFDDAVKLENSYLDQMNTIFAQYQHYGGGMGTITNIFSRAFYWQCALRTIFLLQQDYSSGRFTWSDMPTHAYGQLSFRDVEVLGGCCMVYRREFIIQHQFDEYLTRYAFMEDCDVSRRISLNVPLFYKNLCKVTAF